MSERDDRAIINKNEGGGIFYNSNIESIKPGIRTLNVNFDRMSTRKTLFGEVDGRINPDSYSDRNMLGFDIKEALKKGCHAGNNVYNMAKSSPRDNKMYEVSEISHLKGDRGNQFDNLVELHDPKRYVFDPNIH